MQRRMVCFMAGVLFAGGLSVVGAGPAGAVVADKVNLIGLTDDDKIVTFASGAPGTVAEAKAVTGIAADDGPILGIDVRPANGVLYALTKNALYTIDQSTLAAAKVGSGFTPALDPTKNHGFDFNPAVDRIRVVSDAGVNLRLNPGTGALAATDMTLAYATGDVNAGTAPQVSAAAYTNSFPGTGVLTSTPAPTTTLFGIDTGLDALVIQNPPNAGQLNTPPGGGKLNVGDVTAVNGFDMDVAPGVGPAGNPVTVSIAIAALRTAASDATKLYTIDLTTGAATDEGLVGTGTGLKLKGLAIAAPVGYLAFGADGAVFNFGDADKRGELKGTVLNQPIVGGAVTPSGEGYWLVASDGGIFTYGDAAFFGSTGAVKLNQPIVGMAAYPDGKGYWLVASDGGIFSFFDTTTPGVTDRFYGSTGNVKLNEPVVGMAAYPNGSGYWMVAADGGIFSFFDPKVETDRFYGSTGDVKLNKPITGMAAYPNGEGYWFVATDGGIFSFARTTVVSPTPNSLPARNIVPPGEIKGMAATISGNGYWLVGTDGTVYEFGDAKALGSANNPKPAKDVIAIAAVS